MDAASRLLPWYLAESGPASSVTVTLDTPTDGATVTTMQSESDAGSAIPTTDAPGPLIHGPLSLL